MDKSEKLIAQTMQEKARWVADIKVREAHSFAERQATLIELSHDKKWDVH